jgi:thioredoxin reductase (NADPH)
MSSQLTPLAADVRGDAFPTLTAEQICRIRPLSKYEGERWARSCLSRATVTSLFRAALREAWKSCSRACRASALSSHMRPVGFTGEITMISGRRSLVRGRVTAAGEFLEMSNTELRTLVARDAELSEIFMRAFILRRVELINRGQGNVILLGSRHSAQTLRLREFLTRNGHPHTYVDLDTDTTYQDLLDHFHVTLEEIPVVICNNRTVLRGPSIQELASASASMRTSRNGGAGSGDRWRRTGRPGRGGLWRIGRLGCLVIEAESPGGQAGSSSKIENYLGFPMGISGNELAGRAAAQAQKFGAKMLIANSVTKLNCERRPYELSVDCGQVIRARTVMIASGAQYNKPNIDNLKKFEGQGVYYGATYIEAQLCGKEDVIVVGGGNSAGPGSGLSFADCRQGSHAGAGAAVVGHDVALPDPAHRRKSRDRMHYRTEIVGLDGDTQLERVTWQEQKLRRDFNPRHPARVHYGGSFSAHGVAARMRGPRQQRLHPYRARSGSRDPSNTFIGRFRVCRRCWRPACPECLRWAMSAPEM